MAGPVYDPEKPERKLEPLKQKEEVAPEHERRITDPGARRTSAGKGSRPSEKTGFYSRPEPGDEDGFYKPGGVRSRRVGLFKRKRMIVLVAASGLIAVIASFGGLLSSFKMDFLMKNTDQKTGIRMNASISRREIAYIRAYTQIRMMDVGGDFEKNGNHFFRSNHISTGNPLYDWYKTLRTSKFEADVFNKNGVFFGNFVDANNKIIPGSIKVDGASVGPDNMDAIKKAVQDGDWGKLDNEFSHFFEKVDLANHKAGRAAIKELVDANTQSNNVFKRRRMRKAIQEMAGVRSWRVFDATREKSANSVKDFRNKVIKAALPDDRASSKFLQCFFGISSCSFSADPGAPDNRVGGGSPDKTKETLRDPDGKLPPTTIDYSESAKALQKVLRGAGGIINAGNWASIINSLADADKAIRSGALSAQVAIARGIQAMSFYQIMETARDQMKTGQLTTEQVNDYMRWITNITASEAWVKVVEGKGGVKTAQAAGVAKAVDYCSSKHIAKDGEFAFLCPDTVLGSGVNGAASVEEFYNNGVGRILHPILWNYRKAFGWFGKAFDWVFRQVAGPVVDAVFAGIKAVAPGAIKTVQEGIDWAATKIAAELGVGPMVVGATSNQLGNVLIQGGAFTAEATMRDIGASETTALSQAEAQSAVAAYQQQLSSQSFAARYLSPSNPNSAAAKGLFAVSSIKWSSPTSVFGFVGSMFKSAFSLITLPFSHRVSAAASNNGYVAAQVAGIRTYDFPAQCYNIAPTDLAIDPARGTNIRQILNIPAEQLPGRNSTVWTNSGQWYDYLYKKAASVDSDHPDKLALKIYNCNLLDNAVRGSTGFVYGFTDDNGDVSGVNTSTSNNSTNIELPAGGAKKLADQILSSPNISFTTSFAKQAIVDTSNGQPAAIESRCGAGSSAPLSPTMLGVLLATAQKHKIGIGYLTNGCHSDGSAHYAGKAADINSVDGRSTTGGDADRPFMHELSGILPNGSSLGQVQCSPVPIDPINSISIFNDSCNHIHFEVP